MLTDLQPIILCAARSCGKWLLNQGMAVHHLPTLATEKNPSCELSGIIQMQSQILLKQVMVTAVQVKQLHR